jgi:amino acid permease
LSVVHHPPRSTTINDHVGPLHHANDTKIRLMRRVTIVSVCICAILYCSISVIALADFGTTVQPNVLSCYTDHGRLIQVATAAMALAIVMAFPLNIFPARITLIGLLHSSTGVASTQTPSLSLSSMNNDRIVPLPGIPNDNLTTALLQDIDERPPSRQIVDTINNVNGFSSNGHDHIAAPFEVQPDTMTINRGTSDVILVECHDNGNQPIDTTMDNNGHDQPFDMTVHVVSTLFLTILILVLALILPNISVVFGLLGGTASSWLGFCVPGLLGIQLSKHQSISTGQQQRSMIITSWSLLIGGIVIGILTTGVTIYNTMVHHDS